MICKKTQRLHFEGTIYELKEGEPAPAYLLQKLSEFQKSVYFIAVTKESEPESEHEPETEAKKRGRKPLK